MILILNVQIEAESTENEAYKTKIKTAIFANEAPDIFESWRSGLYQTFVYSREVLALEYYPNDRIKDKCSGMFYHDVL